MHRWSLWWIGSACAGFVLALQDLIFVPENAERIGGRAFVHLSIRMVLVGSALGLLLSAFVALVSRIARSWPRGSRLIEALSGSVLSIPLASSLSRGGGIQQQGLAPVVFVGVLVLAAGCSLAACSFHRRMIHLEGKGARLPRTVAAFVVATLALALDRIDMLAYQGYYPVVHGVLGISVLCLLGYAILWFGRRPLWVGDRSIRRFEILSAPVAILVLFGVDRMMLLEKPHRSELQFRAEHGSRVLRLFEPIDPRVADDVLADARLRFEREDERRRARDARRELDSRAGKARGWNCLWITVDTLRARNLSLYGHKRKTSPELERLAQSAVVYEHAAAQFPITFLSFQSMFHGRYPSATPLYREVKGLPDWAEGALTFATLCTRAGFRTASIPAVSAATLEDPGFRVMAEGFTEVSPGKKGDDLEGAAQVAAAMAYLERTSEKPFFLWVHFMEPHHPYAIHAGLEFGDTQADRYDSEVAASDRFVGQILEKLRALKLDEKTVVVINSDHGEALGEHGTRYHGSTLYEEQIHVPLIVRVPGIPARRVRTAVDNVDIMPTLLDALEIDTTIELQGTSLLPSLLHGDDSLKGNQDLAFAELPPAVPGLSPEATDRRSLRRGRYKLIFHERTGIEELYDLETDPREISDLSQSHPEVVFRLRGEMKELVRESREVNTPPQTSAPRVSSFDHRLASADFKVRQQAFAEALREPTPALQAAILAELARKDAEPGLRARLLLAFPKVFDERREDILRDGLKQETTAGEKLSALTSMLALGPVKLRALSVEAVAGCLSLQRPLSRHAALVLAIRGDRRGEGILRADLSSPDRRVAWRARCGLAHLGEGSVVKDLARDFESWLAAEPSDGILGLRALARLGSTDALPKVIELVKDPYLGHAEKDAVLEYLAGVSGEATIPAFVELLAAWDPTVTHRVHKLAEARFGLNRAARLSDAADAVVAARDLAASGRFDAARLEYARAGDACGGKEARTYYDFLAALLAREAKDRSDLERRVARLTEVVESESMREAARALLLPEAPLGLRFREPRRISGGAPVPGKTVSYEVDLENAGLSPVFPGPTAEARGVMPIWRDVDRDFWIARRPLAVPTFGVLPGARVRMVISGVVPTVPGDYGVRFLLSSSAANARDLPGSDPLLPAGQVLGPALKGRDLNGAHYEKESLVRGFWWQESAFTPTHEEDNTVAWVPTDREPWILSPALGDTGKPIKLTLEIAIFGDGGTENLRVVYGYAPIPGDPSERHVDLPLPTDGQFRTLPAPFPVDAGKSVRMFRIQPCERPHLIRIRVVRFEH